MLTSLNTFTIFTAQMVTASKRILPKAELYITGQWHQWHQALCAWPYAKTCNSLAGFLLASGTLSPSKVRMQDCHRPQEAKHCAFWNDVCDKPVKWQSVLCGRLSRCSWISTYDSRINIRPRQSNWINTGMSLKGAMNTMNTIRPNHPTTCHLHCRVQESSNTSDRKTVAKLSHEVSCSRISQVVFDKKIIRLVQFVFECLLIAFKYRWFMRNVQRCLESPSFASLLGIFNTWHWPYAWKPDQSPRNPPFHSGNHMVLQRMDSRLQ